MIHRALALAGSLALVACAGTEKPDAFQQRIRMMNAEKEYNVGTIPRSLVVDHPIRSTGFPLRPRGQLSISFEKVSDGKICFLDEVTTNNPGPVLIDQELDRDEPAHYYVEKLRAKKYVVEAFPDLTAVPQRVVYLPTSGNILDDVTADEQQSNDVKFKERDTGMTMTATDHTLPVHLCGKAPTIDATTKWITVAHQIPGAPDETQLYFWNIVDDATPEN